MTDATFIATRGSMALRMFAWAVVGATTVFILNALLTHGLGWSGPGALVGGSAAATAIVQAALYPVALALSALFVLRTPARSLRADAGVMSRVVRYLVRWAFWSVFLVGLADIAVSALRVEGILPDLVGEEMASAWGFNQSRAPQVHLPLIALSLLLAAVTPTLGVQWLALLVVLSELAIVITRFVFSYEQAFQGDLVRFWYGALFLFASAYTLVEDGHVRVDVVYAGMSRRTQGMVNAVGCIVLGILFCGVILYFGMATRSAVINAPLISLEITQSGFGMYVKYLMAGFLGVFAVTMMIQFCAYLLDSVADWRDDPGGRPHHVHGEDAVQEF